MYIELLPATAKQDEKYDLYQQRKAEEMNLPKNLAASNKV